MGFGDEVMAAGQARLVRERDPAGRRVRILDRSKRVRVHEIWQGNGDIVPPGVAGNFLYVLNGPGARPYIAEKRPDRWMWKDWPEGAPPRGTVVLTPREREYGLSGIRRIVLEPNIKAKASPNKDWGWIRWNRLAWILQERHGLRITQLGPLGTPLLEGADMVCTNSFREACAVIANSRACVLPEGGLHHAAAAFGVPAVVIFGGFIAPRHTGYAGHVNVFTGGEACGMRVPCEHCREAMAKIAPEAVAEHLLELLRVSTPRHLAA